MKSKKTLFIVLLLIGGLFFISCKKEEGDSSAKETIIGTMSAKIKGEPWSADLPGARIENGITVISGVGLLGEDKRGIILTINKDTTGSFSINYNPLDSTANTLHTGTYSLDGLNLSNPENVYNAFEGEVNITSMTGYRMNGTFDLKCINLVSLTGTFDTLHITEGQFSNVFNTKKR